MFRTLPALFSLGGLILLLAAWGTAVTLGAARPGGHSCFTLGYAHGESWLINAMFYADGFVLCRRFAPNPTQRSGPYAKRSRYDAEHTLTPRNLFPKIQTSPVASGVQFHLAPPLLLFAGLSTWTFFWPLVRRRRRRKRGQCLACGYDLRGGTSPTCPECGRQNPHWLAEKGSGALAANL